jgi:preprotein translocase subunit YajC
MFEFLAQEATPTGSGTSSLLFFAIMAVAFYFLFIRPQRKRQAQIQEVQDNLTVGMDVRTIGGIHGRIIEVEDDAVVLEVEAGRLRVARKGIAGAIGSEG